jgi:type II secretory pathway component PulC
MKKQIILATLVAVLFSTVSFATTIPANFKKADKVENKVGKIVQKLAKHKEKKAAKHQEKRAKKTAKTSK